MTANPSSPRSSPAISEVLPGLWRIALTPLDLLNAYVLGDVLVDAGARSSAKRILTAIEGMDIRAHALTHAHPDHQGSSHVICEKLAIPLYCGEADRAAMEKGEFAGLMPNPRAVMARLNQLVSGPTHPVAGVLREGDEIGGFTVIETPGHTPGHLAFWRASDRALVLGDVALSRDPVTMRLKLREPFVPVTWSVEVNRESAKKLAALEPAVVCFGHGPPLMDGAAFVEFVSRNVT